MGTQQLSITLNGEPRAITASTVADLVQELGVDIRQIAVEHNRTILARPNYVNTAIQHGDTIEIVSFIGGG
ncbi:MAG: sulfur carrier protein ThiS [Alphaproteobacteria bacterium]|nr:sulfur carrier protein ThiS [Alphaproteobacteria bacterium]